MRLRKHSAPMFCSRNNFPLAGTRCSCCLLRIDIHWACSCFSLWANAESCRATQSHPKPLRWTSFEISGKRDDEWNCVLYVCTLYLKYHEHSWILLKKLIKVIFFHAILMTFKNYIYFLVNDTDRSSWTMVYD